MGFAAIRSLAAILAVLAGCASARAADFSFAGDFRQDDEHRNFSFTIAEAATVTVRTLSYGGGTNAAGAAVPAGGFDPTLAVFDSSGALIAVNRDAGCASAQRDPATQLCWDSLLSFSAPAGAYQVVLTESENAPSGPTINDPFIYDGAGNFTADPEDSASNGFWDFSLHRRTSAFAVDILGVDSAQLGLMPAISALINAASALAGPVAPNDILTYYDAGLAGGPVTVTIGGQAATVLFSGASQMNFVTPGSLGAGSSASFQISRGGTMLLSTNVSSAAVNPALFTDNAQGSGQGAVLNQDYTLNSAAAPAKRGEYIIAYGTGFGAVLPPGANGLSVLASGVSATLGGVQADVSYAGLVPGATPGLQQFNILAPANAPVGPAVGIQLMIGGTMTQPGVTVAIQ